MNFSPIFVFICGALLAMLPVVETKGAIPFAMSAGIWGDAALTALWAWLAAVVGGIIVSFIAAAIFLPLRKILERWKPTKSLLAFCDKKVHYWLEMQNSRKKPRKIKAKKPRKSAEPDAQINLSTEKPYKSDTTPDAKIDFSVTFAPKKKERTRSPTQPHKIVRTGTFKKALIVFIFCAIPIPFSGVWSAAALCSVLQLNYLQSVTTLALANILSAVIIGLFCFFLNEFVDVILCALGIILILAIIYRVLKVLITHVNSNKTPLSNEIIEK